MKSEEHKENVIRIINAYGNNLKQVSLEIPKKKITVFTGVSGSGKSSLCLDTIAAASRRELNETFPSFVQQYLPKYGRPEVERIENLPVTIVIDQKKPTANSRSTVGTYTDIYALLRLLFSRVGRPFAGYSDSFSFNHPAGSCGRCGGLGVVTELDIHKLVDFDKCLNDEGVINYPAFTTGAWRWKRYAYSGLFDLDKKIRDYSEEELQLFLYSPQNRLKNPPANWPKTAKFEGIYPRMYRSIINTKEGQHYKKVLDKMVSTFTCPDCGGSRINERVRGCFINGKNIAQVADMPIPEAVAFVESIEAPLARDLKEELIKRLGALVEIGLSYLSLSRGTDTLSGGEAQRIKIAKYINSPLSDMLYVLDEPSVGLHPKDIGNMKRSLIKLREHGNTVIIVEHHRDVISLADHVVDMGPEAGAKGGRLLFAKENHVSQSLFSFNSKGGCPVCQERGIIVSDMAYMDAIETVCEVCGGSRYSDEAVSHLYRGKNIAEVMDFSVEQALGFFADQPFAGKLDTLMQVGLSYLHLNQSMTTLSGGELQRVKLADRLDEKGRVFILDEPTDGLLLNDIRQLIKVFDNMTDRGNTLFIIEHSPEVMKNADYIIELGPGGGHDGGALLYAGIPRKIVNEKNSVTGIYLRDQNGYDILST